MWCFGFGRWGWRGSMGLVLRVSWSEGESEEEEGCIVWDRVSWVWVWVWEFGVRNFFFGMEYVSCIGF